MLQRCPILSVPSSGWTWTDHPYPKSDWSKFLTHPDLPQEVIEVNHQAQELVLHRYTGMPASRLLTQAIVGTANLPRHFLCAFPAVRAHGPLSPDRFWACLDAAHGPEAWARIEALDRMAHRWLLLAGLTGTWTFSLVRGQHISRMPPRGRPAGPYPSLDAIEPTIVHVLQQTEGRLRPNGVGSWTCAPAVQATLPDSAHARMALQHMLRPHAENDAALFGISPDGMLSEEA